MLTGREIRLIKRLFFLMVPYSILRIGFYFYHLNIYKFFTQEEIFRSFLLGVRFDIAAICLLNIPIVFLAIFPILKEKWERFLYIFINTIGLIISVDDFELFLFTGKRLSYDFFLITEDILQQLPQVTLNYWYLPFISIAIGIGFYFFDAAYFSVKKKAVPLWTQMFTGILIFGITFIGIRGGLQHKSINIQSAFVQGKNELGHLVLNTPYHFLRTLKNTPLKEVKFFANDNKAKDFILNRRDFRDGVRNKVKTNVVIIILESFSSEYVDQGYTPFLSELKSKSLSFERHLANGRRSIEALPSILCGLPALIDEPISKSIYQGNKFNCMPKFLKMSGYTNYFFHAGAKGTMGFEAYTLGSGFDKYFSRADYGPEDYDGTWGVFDEEYLQYFGDELNKMPRPFLAGVFTLSSHQPYTIPEKLRGKFPKGSLEIHESIGYTDYALKRFFEKVEKEVWFKDTLFIITADHTQKLETKKYLSLVGHYRVPLLFYAPGLIEAKNSSKITQHSDIPASVLDFTGIKGDLPLTSVSVFNDDPGIAVNYADGSTYFLVNGEELITSNKSFESKSYHYNWETGALQSKKSEDPLLFAHLQYFLNGLIKNNLSL